MSWIPDNQNLLVSWARPLVMYDWINIGEVYETYVFEMEFQHFPAVADCELQGEECWNNASEPLYLMIGKTHQP